MDYYFKIAQTVVKISFERDYIKEYLEKDYELLSCQPCEPSVYIEIRNNDTILPPIIKNDKSIEFKSENGYLYQYFTAFQRHFWIRYCFSGGKTEIVLYIPYGNNGVSRQFLSPYFEKPLQSCLTDFFHNTFLAVLQCILMSHNASLLHCSAFQSLPFKEAVILAGGAQSGKSSLMTALSKFEPIKIIAEDFAVVNSYKELYGYLHQTRIKFSDMKEAGLQYQPNRDGFFTGILNRCNKRVYSLLTKNQNGRHISIKNYYKGDVLCDHVSLKRRVFLLTRSDAGTDITPVDLQSFCRIQAEILMSEFSNMHGAMRLFKFYSELKGDEWCEEHLYNNIYNIYKNAFKDLKCYNIDLPYYPHLESAAKELKRIILTLDNQ